MDEESPLLLLPPNEKADDEDGASFVGPVFNLSTTIVGAGIMALPDAMKVLGLGLDLVELTSLMYNVANKV
ncbi:amino acid transporter AVT6A-like [Senna tora]|uniref:Amino acid transporter AVT6A-like n=1 Tax=Senna tora TaxID=362788 RepID=A0A834W5T8_9FABA|nr:amino acid transporter AVT6A-like [Senna tora]